MICLCSQTHGIWPWVFFVSVFDAKEPYISTQKRTRKGIYKREYERVFQRKRTKEKPMEILQKKKAREAKGKYTKEKPLERN